MIMVDQFRPDRLDYAPSLGILGKEATLFNNMITYAPYTLASMPAIFTGIYGNRTGVNAYFQALSFRKDQCFTLPQYLKKRGYFTMADMCSKIMLPHQGFDEVHIHDEYKDDLTVRHTNTLKNLVKRREPFFVFLHYSNIHTAIVSDVINVFEDFDERYFGHLEKNQERYNGYIKKADVYLENIFSVMRQLGLWNKCLLVVHTDHGCSNGERPGEKAYGIYLYDYTLRVFCYLKGLGIPSNLSYSTQVRTIDILPTILDYLGIDEQTGYEAIQGRSLFPVMRGEEMAHREAFSETGGLDGPFPSTHEPNLKCVRTERWKFIFNITTQQKELYCLKDDPQEVCNLAGRGLEIEDVLLKQLLVYDSKLLERQIPVQTQAKVQQQDGKS